MIRDEPLSDETFWTGYALAAREGWADLFVWEWRYVFDGRRPVHWTGDWPPTLTEPIRHARDEDPAS